MMGSSHAASGLLAGVGVGALAGSHPVDMVVCAAVGAGAALLPDLDEPGSTVGRSLGLVTHGLSVVLRATSCVVYKATATGYELRDSRTDGGHRYLTHTIPAVMVFGALAWGLSALGALGAGLVVFSMAALGLGLVLRPWGRGAVQSAGLVAAALAAGAVYLPGGAPFLLGATVAAGALVHILGDWLTRSGVPLAWPLEIRGKRWWMLRSPLAFRTGQSVAETAIRWGCTAGAPAVVLLAA